MGLLDTIKSGVGTAFNIVDDLTTEITIVDQNARTYDPTTGAPTITSQTVDVKAVLVNVTDKDVFMGGAPQEASRKALVEAADMSFVPSVNSEVSWDDSQTYYTLRVDKDPSNSLYSIWLKAG